MENASVPQEKDDFAEQSMETLLEKPWMTHSADHLAEFQGMTLPAVRQKNEASPQTYFPRKVHRKWSAKMQDSLENRLPEDY